MFYHKYFICGVLTWGGEGPPRKISSTTIFWLSVGNTNININIDNGVGIVIDVNINIINNRVWDFNPPNHCLFRTRF